MVYWKNNMQEFKKKNVCFRETSERMLFNFFGIDDGWKC